jgi:hypothetical protein
MAQILTAIWMNRDRKMAELAKQKNNFAPTSEVIVTMKQTPTNPCTSIPQDNKQWYQCNMNQYQGILCQPVNPSNNYKHLEHSTLLSVTNYLPRYLHRYVLYGKMLPTRIKIEDIKSDEKK